MVNATMNRQLEQMEQAAQMMSLGRELPFMVENSCTIVIKSKSNRYRWH